METLIICGQSMFPSLKQGAKVLVKNVPTSQIGKRDIIVFKKDYQIVCHRVTKIFKDSNNRIAFFTKGDFNFKLKERVKENEVLGRIVGIYKNGRLKSLWLEHIYPYYFIINLISFAKEAFQCCIERLYGFFLIRKLLKLFFSLKIEYSIVTTENADEDFKSFYNFFPFDNKQFEIVYRIFATYKKKPVGKLWILKDKSKGDILLYGPYVKLLFRRRNIGTDLVKKALDLICAKIKRELAYAFIVTNKNILSNFFKKLGFILERNCIGSVGENVIILKKIFS